VGEDRLNPTGTSLEVAVAGGKRRTHLPEGRWPLDATQIICGVLGGGGVVGKGGGAGGGGGGGGGGGWGFLCCHCRILKKPRTGALRKKRRVLKKYRMCTAVEITRSAGLKPAENWTVLQKSKEDFVSFTGKNASSARKCVKKGEKEVRKYPFQDSDYCCRGGWRLEEILNLGIWY